MYECTMICELCGKETDIEIMNTRIINYNIMKKNCWIVCEDCSIDLEDNILQLWYH